MSLASDLRVFLLNSTGVSSLVGSSASGRIHYNEIPQSIDDSLARIWYQVADDVTERTLDGQGGLHEARIDLECFARDNPSSAIALAAAVKSRLDGQTGALNSTGSGVRARGMFVEGKSDDYIPRMNFSDEGHDVVALDVLVFYTT